MIRLSTWGMSIDVYAQPLPYPVAGAVRQPCLCADDNRPYGLVAYRPAAEYSVLYHYPDHQHL
jgi:hypothetical protein